MKLETAQRHSLKIIAIFFAISLWFYVLNSEPEEVERRVEVEYILPNNMAFANVVEKQLNVKIKGSKAFISNVLSNNEKLVVDLKPFYEKFGKNFKVTHYHSQINVPFGVEVLEIVPKNTWIELDKVIQVELPIKIHQVGIIPPTVRLNIKSIEPDSVRVSGPMSLIKKIGHVKTYPVDLSTNIDKFDDMSLNLSLEDLDSRLKYENHSQVTFKYQFEKVDTEKKEKKDFIKRSNKK